MASKTPPVVVFLGDIAGLEILGGEHFSRRSPISVATDHPRSLKELEGEP
jgi:hypothetical protein